MFENATKLVDGNLNEAEAKSLLTKIGFSDWETAQQRLSQLADSEAGRSQLKRCLPMLLASLSEAAAPDGSLVNFDRFVQSVPDRTALFEYLGDNPRAVEILVKLFVGSQFLTEILLRNPNYLEQLTQHKRVAEFKSREELADSAWQHASEFHSLPEKMDALRRFQRWELLRIGACDSFGLMDLRAVTTQLSLLADAVVRTSLRLSADELQVAPEGFAVLGFGKLGGEELNYSSDIDLVFIADGNATNFWTLGQRLIKALNDATSEGFLYRIDMRLRPWGSSGALVSSVDSYLEYLRKHGRLWEKQALLKARVIAGSAAVGESFLSQVQSIVFDCAPEQVRENIHSMKTRIEEELRRQGRKWGEVKSGVGSIRDIEFVTQYLQMSFGRDNPIVRSFNTLDALVRLAEFSFIDASEYRQLTSGYVFLRTIEHALQLMHNKQVHSLPDDNRELSYLARRLDFGTAELFTAHYQQHCRAIRTIYERYIEGKGTQQHWAEESRLGEPVVDHAAGMEESYRELFSEEEIARHAQMLKRLSDDNLAEVEASPGDDDTWTVSIAGFDTLGDLSMICGLLSVYGFDIVDGQVFTNERIRARKTMSAAQPRKRAKKKADDNAAGAARKFIDVFTVRTAAKVIADDVWNRYRDELCELMSLAIGGRLAEAQGQLVKKVARALRGQQHLEKRGGKPKAAINPITIEVDNDISPEFTVFQIRAEDTIGFLYEFSNALALAEIDIVRVIVSSQGNRVFDTLYVTDEAGSKIVDEAKQREVRTAAVLIKHFTHLLPRSPNPESALLHFRQFLEQMFNQPTWMRDLASLERPDVLDALARLLGISDFLWEDFLRLQHENLFPIVRDQAALARRKEREELDAELQSQLDTPQTLDEKRTALNAFKDREMFRVDMRHILGHIDEFGQFSAELTDVAEAVVLGATAISLKEVSTRYGNPLLDDGSPCRFSVCSLGKCGGRELGFASDIELMFVYEGSGKTTGPEVITTTEFFQRLVEIFTHSIQARRKGIFEIDLRLRPYGSAGSVAVSFDAFETYFGPGGAAWPYERQALVKLRPIGGDKSFGQAVVEMRDSLIYVGEQFDVHAMRAMRERQISQLVKAGTVNAKLGPGGLVEIEYLIQGLQMTYGDRDPALRETNTRMAMASLRDAKILTDDEYLQLLEAYKFQRRLIDALRMVRGNARDLTVPPPDSEEFEYLARRLNYGRAIADLQADLEKYTMDVQELEKRLDTV